MMRKGGKASGSLRRKQLKRPTSHNRRRLTGTISLRAFKLKNNCLDFQNPIFPTAQVSLAESQWVSLANNCGLLTGKYTNKQIKNFKINKQCFIPGIFCKDHLWEIEEDLVLSHPDIL